MSGLEMSISTSGLLICLARPSPITSGRYLVNISISKLSWSLVTAYLYLPNKQVIHAYLDDFVVTLRLI